MTKDKNITLITVTYKSSHIILDAYRDIAKKGYKIKIVDNGSNDDIEETLKSNFKNSNIELILLDNNVGFSKANNLALKKVDTDYALLLNPDAIINENSVEKLCNCLEKYPNVAMAGALDIKSQNPEQEKIDLAVNNYRRIFKVTEENEDYLSVNFLCGGYVALKMEVFRKIGFFDEKLFLYGDDDELCKRSLDNGYLNVLVKESYSFHRDHSATKTTTTLEKYKLLYKRYWYMGWSKAYLKRKKRSYLQVLLKAIVQLLSVSIYILKGDKNRSITRLGRSLGSISNLFGIDCFNRNNKNPRIKEVIKI